MGRNPPCASCKLLRRRCVEDCIFAPFFPSDEPQKFAIVHKVFGASNVSKMLQKIPFNQRGDAVSSLVYEANARIQDPIYGCVGAISYLHNQISQLQMQLAATQAEMLCLQTQQDHHLPDDNSFVFVDNINQNMNVSQLLNLASSSSSNNTAESQAEFYKMESLWT